VLRSENFKNQSTFGKVWQQDFYDSQTTRVSNNSCYQGAFRLT